MKVNVGLCAGLNASLNQIWRDDLGYSGTSRCGVRRPRAQL